jgi:carboxymethylenebutenolidase
MLFGSALAALLSLVVLFSGASPFSVDTEAYENAYGQTSNQMTPDSMMRDLTKPHAIRGQISSIQFGSAGEPEWIQSGIWVIRMSPGPDPELVPQISLIARMAMVMPDGNAMHEHSVYDFNAADLYMEGNTTYVAEGTATVTMRDGPVAEVPVTIKVFGGSVIAFWIGPDKVDSHFGANPVYGTLSDASRNIAGSMSMDSMHGTKPANATSVELEGLSRTTVNYHGNAAGYLVYPENATESELPGVVMIHEWWGLNQNIKNMAEQLAKEGYAVLAVDLYNGEVATESSQAGMLASSVRENPQLAIENLNAAVEHLSSLPSVNGSRMASLGWCFGGGQSLQLALNTEQPLAATVIYYGNLVTNQTELSVISWPVLGIFGSEDQGIPVETVNQFEAALEANSIANEIHIYEGVGHAFANPSGDNYSPEQTADAWAKTLDFLERNV